MAITVNNTTSTKPSASVAQSKSASKKDGGFLRSFGKPATSKELLFFASQLSLMIEIGTPMNIALEAIREQTENKAFNGIIQDMLKDIEAGRQLSDSMNRHPRVFNKVFVSMIRAGETVGLLKEMLDRMVEMEEKRQALKTQVKSALTYPVILCVVATLVIIFVLVGVLPKFTTFFEGKESILPFMTRFLMALSRTLIAYWWAYIISPIAVATGLFLFFKSEAGASLIDKLILTGPFVRKVSHKIFNSQLLRTLGNLMDSQVPLMEALEVTRGTIGNRFFRDFIDKIMDHVRDGGKFSRPFATYAYTLESVKQMVATGEESGNLSKVMLRLADFYDDEVDRDLKGLSSMIEPLALIIMGGVVGLIVSSVILPLFRLSHAFQ